MEPMISILIVLILAAAFVYWRTRQYKDAFLDKLPLLPGEEVLFEEECHRLEANVRLRQVRSFPNSVVRMTSSRLITAQKVMGSDRKALRYVFHFTADDEAVEPFKGYTAMKIKKDAVKLVDQRGEITIEIRPTVGAGSLTPYSIRITPRDLSSYKKALGL